MSVLNTTLKKLEKREQSVEPGVLAENTVEVESITDIGAKLHAWVLPLLGGIAIVLTCYILFKKDPLQDYFRSEANADIINNDAITPRLLDPLATTAQVTKEETAPDLPTNRQLATEREQKLRVIPTRVVNHSASSDEQLAAEAVTAQSQESRNTAPQQTQTAKVNTPSPSMKQVAKVSAEQQAQAYFQAGKKAFNFGLVSDAISELQSCIASMAEHVECRSLLAAAYYGRKDTDQASELLEQGLNLKPGSMEWRTLLAKIYADEKQYEKVLSVLSQQYERDAQADFWILKGIAAQRLEQHEKALRSFKKLVKAQAGEGKWWLAMGSSAEALQQWQNALQYYTTATQVGNLSPAQKRHAARRLQAIRGQFNAS